MRVYSLTDIKDFFARGHERTIKAKKNIFALFIIKGLNITIGLIIVPLTITYLNPTKYGIWITLSSIIAWFSFFDIGLGNGLRNRFTEALANGNHKLAKTYVSTTYAALVLMMGLVLILFNIVNPFLNWATILNAGNNRVFQNELRLLAVIVFSSFCMRFIFELIATILIADQQPAKASLLNLYSNVLSLLFIFILIKTSTNSLIYLGTIFSTLPVLVFSVSSFWFFNKKYKYYKPSVKSIEFSKVKDLFSLGFKFFFIQISGVVLYTSDYVIISQLFSPADVTPYQIANKYFGLVPMFFMIIVTPFWSAITEAFKKDEIGWIKKSVKRLIRIWKFATLVLILMLLFSVTVYKIWIGNQVVIPFSLSIAWAFFFIIQTLHSIYITFLNGAGIVKLQSYISIISACINIPLSILLAKTLHFNITGVIVATLVTQILGLFLAFIQYNKIVKGNAKGIWTS